MSPPEATSGQPLWGLFNTLTTAPWALAYVALLPESKANAHLCSLMELAVPGIVVAAVPLRDLTSNPFALGICNDRIQKAEIGIQSLAPGYYLFRHGELVGYHPASPEDGDLDLSLKVGLGALAISALFGGKNPLEDAFKFGLGTWEVRAAGRAATHFKKLIEILTASDSRQQEREEKRKRARAIQEKVTRDTMTEVCEILGVTPTSTPDEVKSAYRRAARRVHSDRNHAENDDKMKAINHARDVYVGLRGWERL